MSRQQMVRDRIRAAWSLLLDKAFGPALAAAQAEGSAKAVVDDIWPHMGTDDISRLDSVDTTFLAREGGVPADFHQHLEEALAVCAEDHLQDIQAGNPHAGGAKLRRIIRQEIVARLAEIQVATDAITQSGRSECYAQAATVRDRALVLLNDRVLDELLTPVAIGQPEEDRKRQLKILTALTLPGGNRQQRDEILSAIRTGSTSSFPLVAKYITRGAIPVVPQFPADMELTDEGFTPELLTLIPHAAHVQRCLRRYQTQDGILCRFLMPEGGVSPDYQGTYDKLADVTPVPGTPLVAPKRAVLTTQRRERYRIPDGVVCSLACCVLLESLLRQVAHVSAIQGADKARGGDLLKRMETIVPFSPRTVELLRVVFPERGMAMRDAVVHGAFFADDPNSVAETVGGLTQTLKHLVADLHALGLKGKVFGTAAWDANASLASAVVQTFAAQSTPGYALADSWDVPTQQHIFALLRALTPDKRLLGECAFFFHLHEQLSIDRGNPPDDDLQFIALFCCLAVLEELIRAAFEVHGLPVLRVTPDGRDVVKCELAMLDDAAGQLLDPTAVARAFGSDLTRQQEFHQSLAAVKAFRDRLLHGAWQALQPPFLQHSNLVLKVMSALCSRLEVEQGAASNCTSHTSFL